jgi:hypothetical protein
MARVMKDGIQETGDRALAIGARDMDAPETVVGVADCGQKGKGPLEAQLDPGLLEIEEELK